MFQSQNEQCVKYSKSHDLTKREGGNEILFYFDSSKQNIYFCLLILLYLTMYKLNEIKLK